MGEDEFASGQKDACWLTVFETCHGTYKGKLNSHIGARFYIVKDIYIPRALNFYIRQVNGFRCQWKRPLYS